MEKKIRDLFIDELCDIRSAEEQIVKALPDMITGASSPDLKNAFKTHLEETKEQIKRLEKIFKLLAIDEKEILCKAAKGLIEECKEVFKKFEKSPLRDAALISKAQRIEHYEISAYGTLRTFAKELRLREIADLLKLTLNEESNADKKLTKIAEGGFFSSGINHLANTTPKKPSIRKPRIAKKAPAAKPKPKRTTLKSVKVPKKTKRVTAKR